MSAENLEQIEEWKIEAFHCLEGYAEGFNDALDPSGDVQEDLMDLRDGLLGYAERTHEVSRLPLAEVTNMIDTIRARYDR